MHFGHLNVNSLFFKIEELRTQAFKHFFVLRITEIKLDKTVSNEELKSDGYNFLRLDRYKNGGGVAATSKIILLIIDNHVFLKTLKSIFLDILLPKSKPITLGIIYRPPN